MTMSLAILTSVVLATFIMMAGATNAIEYATKKRKHRSMNHHGSTQMDLEVSHR